MKISFNRVMKLSVLAAALAVMQTPAHATTLIFEMADEGNYFESPDTFGSVFVQEETESSLSTDDLTFASSTPQPTDIQVDGSLSTASAVPEPATWIMVIAGFGLVGWQLQRRRRHATGRGNAFARA